MNKPTKGLMIVAGAFALVFIVMVYVAVPKIAALTLPFRWGAVPLDQPRTLVRQYYGRPFDTTIALTDEWRATRQNGEYVLKVTYTKDSIAQAYKLYFNYSLAFFHKQYLLVEKP